MKDLWRLLVHANKLTRDLEISLVIRLQMKFLASPIKQKWKDLLTQRRRTFSIQTPPRYVGIITPIFSYPAAQYAK